MKLVRRNKQPPETQLVRRPSETYSEQIISMTKGELIIMLTKYGLGRKEICEQLGVTTKWFDNMMGRNTELQGLVFEARRIADTAVVNALFRRAVGYNYVETVFDEKGGEKRSYKHQPPDVTACIFWLKNRMKDEWAESSSVNLTLRDRMELGNRQISLTRG